MIPNFRAALHARGERIRMGILFPDEQELPNSSLAHYLAVARANSARRTAKCFIGSAGLDMDGLLAALASAEASGEPYALLGASYSFVHLLDELQRQRPALRPAAGQPHPRHRRLQGPVARTRAGRIL
jgi:hypothetical protein